MKAGKEKSKRSPEQYSPPTLLLEEQLPFSLSGLSHINTRTNTVACCGAAMKTAIGCKSFTLVGPRCKSWGGTASYVHPKAPCPPRVPALCRETEDSPPTTKQLSGNYVCPFCPCSPHFEGFIPNKNTGRGNDLAVCPILLRRVKALCVYRVFLGYLCICVSVITGEPI